MSQWTHIIGSMKLDSPIFNYKKNKKGDDISYFVDPDKQFIISPAMLCKRLNDKKETIPSLVYEVYEYSLPRVQPLFEKWMKEIMPQGETGFTYYLNQAKGDFSGSSGGLYTNCEKNVFKQRIEHMYKDSDNYYRIHEYKSLVDMYNLNVSWVHHCTDFTLTLCDDIRYCSGKELLKSIESLLMHIGKNDISVNSCCIEWHDEYNETFYYRLVDEYNNSKLRCDIISNEDNSILASKWYEPNENIELEGVPPYKMYRSESWTKYIDDWVKCIDK